MFLKIGSLFINPEKIIEVEVMANHVEVRYGAGEVRSLTFEQEEALLWYINDDSDDLVHLYEFRQHS
jgi:hypothetical protein